jgi:lysophospholipase L1-like esterase
MSGTDEHRRPVWAWVAVIATLAVVVPLVALLLREPPAAAPDDDGRVLASSPRAATATTQDAPSTTPTTPSTTPSTTPLTTTTRSAPRGPTRALFFGDSYFIGGGYTDESNSMARIASNRLGWASEINGGGGTGFVTGNPDYGIPNFLGQIADGAFDVGRRSWVVIEGGNDDRRQAMDDVNRNARKVLRKAQRRFPDATVVLVGPLDTDGDWSDTKPVVKALRKAAARRGVPFVNAQRWLAGHYDEIGPDYVHPTPKGHRICARKLTQALRALGA